MEGHEEGCDSICEALFDMLAGQGRAEMTWGFASIGMQMGASDDGFCVGISKIVNGT